MPIIVITNLQPMLAMLYVYFKAFIYFIFNLLVITFFFYFNYSVVWNIYFNSRKKFFSFWHFSIYFVFITFQHFTQLDHSRRCSMIMIPFFFFLPRTVLYRQKSNNLRKKFLFLKKKKTVMIIVWYRLFFFSFFFTIMMEFCFLFFSL